MKHLLALLAVTAASLLGQVTNIPGGGSNGGTGTVTSVTCNSGLTGGTFTGSGTCATDKTLTPQKFFGTAAPGSVAGNTPGDLFTDTTNHNEYVCNAPSGTSAPACTSVSTAGWLLVNGGSGGGASSAYQLTDFNVTKTSGTVETMCSTCGATIPSNLRIGSVVFTLTTSPTVTISGTSATDNVYWYLSSAQVLTAGYNGAETLTCAAGITCVTGVTGFPSGSIPLWVTTLTANVWDTIAPGTMDKRAVYSILSISPGTGMAAFTFNPSTGAVIINAASSGTATVSDSIQFPAASIQNAAAAITLWDTGVTNGGHTSASGMGGATINPAVLTFDTSGLGEARFYYRLPHTWTGTISLTFGTESVAGAGVTNTISVKTVCVASGGVYLGPTYNGAQTVNVVSNSNAAVVVEGTISTLTTTGCSVDNLLIVDVIKSDANAALNVMYAAMQVSHQ